MLFWGPQVECYDLKTYVWLTHWHAIDLWWSASTLIFVGFRVTLERNLQVCLWGHLQRVLRGATHSECGWCHPIGRGPRLNQKQSVSDPLALIYLSLLPDGLDMWPAALRFCCHREGLYPLTAGQSKPFLPDVTFCHVFCHRNEKSSQPARLVN